MTTIPPRPGAVQGPRKERFVKWSNSALTTLQQCGERFRRRYLEREYTPPSARMVRGTAVHTVARQGYQRRLRGEALPSVEEAQDLAATAFDVTWRAGVVLAPDEAADGLQAVRDRSKDFAVDVAGYHVERVAPAVRPLAVERRIVVKPKDAAIEIHGTIDLIDEPVAGGGEVIRDLKTSDKAPQGTAAHTSQQLSMYALVRHAETGRLPRGLVLDHLVRTPVTAKKTHIVQHTERTAEDVQALVHRINTAVSAVERGIFVPANPDSWWCSANWCEFYGSCKYVRRGERRPQS
jgi:PD-(D/E)XK nuclease superfamily